MLSKSKRKEIAKRIAQLEQKRINNPEFAKEAEDELMAIPEKYELDLVDLLEIDDMVQRILNN